MAMPVHVHESYRPLDEEKGRVIASVAAEGFGIRMNTNPRLAFRTGEEITQERDVALPWHFLPAVWAGRNLPHITVRADRGEHRSCDIPTIQAFWAFCFFCDIGQGDPVR